MTANKLYLLLFSLLLTSHTIAQQTVGIVLSGGGATGLAHIGVLKALEENDIPIDYITGTSAGALVGSLYAAGYSPEEIEILVTSPEFQLMAAGGLEPDQRFVLREESPNAGMIGLSIATDSIIQRSLPTNFTSSAYLDFEMMKLLGTVSASYQEDFDKLFVPFRCVASDITKKESVIFHQGHLNEAVRASMTYPFFFQPLKVDNNLLFDGGLYNNFPADVMYDDFQPDFIIGSNVSFNASPPDEQDLIGQLTNMLVSYTDYTLPCEEGFVIEPHSSITSFDFANAQQAIDDGYNATLAQMDSIKMYVERRSIKSDIDQRRKKFREGIIPLKVKKVSSHSSPKIDRFAKSSLIREKRNEIIGEKELEKRYFRLYSTPQVEFIYPNIQLLDDSTYQLDLEIRKAKDLKVEIGGHLSSRPVNTGYFGLSYQSLGRIATRTKLESYFGKFYGSAKATFILDAPAVYPFSSGVYFTLNRWDYFRSFATFFEESKPSFLVQNEIYTGLWLKQPITNTIQSTIDGRIFKLDDSYYQTEEFTNTDTTDVTNFNGYSVSWGLNHNTLNRKQFANSGHYFGIKARYVYGREHSTSGSTSISPYDIINNHQWLNVSLDFQSFMIDNPHFHFGIQGQMVFNSQTLFANYTASLLSMTEFSLVPDAKTHFLPEYRSPQFIGAGINTIFTIGKNLDLRVDGFLYQPFIQVIEEDNGDLSLSPPFKGETFMASASAVYNSFIGPIRFTFNYFPKQDIPYELQFSLGYVLFNERAIR